MGRIVRKCPSYGPLHTLKKETNELMHKSWAHVIFCVTFNHPDTNGPFADSFVHERLITGM
jgi:hypothetical protein